jgi:hypothetical protein
VSSPATGPALEARDLLEIGELRDFHAVAPAFPAEPPGAQRRAFPVVLDEAQIVDRRIDADGVERLEISSCRSGGEGLRITWYW